MKVYIWEYVSKCSDNYHSGGGVVVFAGTLERARELANNTPGCCISANESPDEIRQIDVNAPGGEQVFIFPDAGCC